jgi:hypothetical protein
LPSATEDGVGFSNGTCGDFALATGTLLNAGIVVGSDGTFHPDFTQEITPTKAGEKLFGGSLDAQCRAGGVADHAGWTDAHRPRRRQRHQLRQWRGRYRAAGNRYRRSGPARTTEYSNGAAESRSAWRRYVLHSAVLSVVGAHGAGRLPASGTFSPIPAAVHPTTASVACMTPIWLASRL